MHENDSLHGLRTKLDAFAVERDWVQFHNPKNLVMALASEVGELTEHFQWLTPGESERLSAETLAEVELEIADVLLFLVRVADRLGIDPIKAAQRKLELNARKYPVDKARGKSTKYDKL